MTFMIILGAVAAVYLLLLLFRLAALALPVCCGSGIGLWMLERGAGHGASIGVGLLAAILLLLYGRGLCAILPPLLRVPVALIFAMPAGFAGYQAANGIAGLMLTDRGALLWLGVAGACAGVLGAWRSLGGAPASAAPSAVRVEPVVEDG